MSRFSYDFFLCRAIICMCGVQDRLPEDDPAEGEDQDGRGHPAHGQVTAGQERHPAHCQLGYQRANFLILINIFIQNKMNFFPFRESLRPARHFL